jgi:hypothetical protein
MTFLRASNNSNNRRKTYWKKIKGVSQKYQDNLVGGTPTPLKNMKVGWDYYSQHMEKYKMFQTTNQI